MALQAYSYSLWVIQLTVGAIFAFSAAVKVIHPRDFLEGVREYQILPKQLTATVAVAVICAEAVLAILHLSGRLLAIALPLGALTLGAFVTAISINLARHANIQCHCFGAGRSEIISYRTLARASLALLAEIVLIQRLRMDWRTSMRPEVHTGQETIEAIAWVAVLLQASMWAINCADLSILVSRWYMILRHQHSPSK